MGGVVMNTLISVVISHFNRVELITDTLSSLSAQTYPHWEAWVVDDGSDPASLARLAELAARDERIRLIERPRLPKGANACRNIGAELAQGDYLIFLDSDDLLAPHALEQRARAAREFPGFDYLVFQVEKFRQVPGDTGELWAVDGQHDHLARFLQQQSVWHTTGPLWRRTALQRIGGFDERLACWQDLDLHVRALAAGLSYRVCFELPPDCHYRLHDMGSISQQPFSGRHKLASLATFFQTCAGLEPCIATAERRDGLQAMARNVGLRLLETRQFDLFENVDRLQRRLGLFPRRLRWRFKLLELFFRLGGYSIKGTHRLQPAFQRLLES